MPTQIHFGVLATIPGGTLNAIVPSAGVSETLTATGSNQQTTITAGSGQTTCRVTSDVAVYVEVGANPDATNNTGGRLLLMAGGTEYFAASQGDKAAVVTA